MPNIICHTLFMDDVFDSLEPSMQEWMEPRKQLLRIGANGPDILFFHGYNLKRLHQTELRHLGSKMHHVKTNEFYIKAVDCIEKEKNETIKKDMLAYVCGHLCHWALDSITHPYIFYRTGNCKGESAWWHHRFESILDAVMLKIKRDCTIENFRIGEICDAPLEVARAIARVYVPISNEVFNVEMKPHQIVESLQDWNFVQGVFYDPSGKKDKTVRSIEKVFGSENMLSGYLVPNKADDPYDVCNAMHERWCYPVDETMVSTESFLELYDKAMLVAKNAIRLFIDAINNDQGKIDLVYFLQDKNYDCGISEEKEMIHFNTIWKSEK